MKRALCTVMLIGFLAPQASALPILPEYVAAIQALPSVSATANEAANLVSGVADLVYLPMGASELILSPLPGLGLNRGGKNLGRGLMAPFSILQSVIRLPATAIRGANSAIQGAPGYLLP